MPRCRSTAHQGWLHSYHISRPGSKVVHSPCACWQDHNRPACSQLPAEGISRAACRLQGASAWGWVAAVDMPPPVRWVCRRTLGVGNMPAAQTVMKVSVKECCACCATGTAGTWSACWTLPLHLDSCVHAGHGTAAGLTGAGMLRGCTSLSSCVCWDPPAVASCVNHSAASGCTRPPS
jgi:hypothetical protein